MNRSRIALTVLVLSACTTAVAQEYELHIIPALSTFGIPEAYLWDVNDDGVGAGMMTFTRQLPNGNFSTTYAGYLWTEATGPQVYVEYSSIAGINNHGDMAAGNGVRWATGGFTPVPPLSGFPTIHPTDINDHGMFVGVSHWRSTSSTTYRRAIYWTQATGTVDLASHVASAWTARDVNNVGQIVGTTSFSLNEGSQRAYLFDTRTHVHTNLHNLLNGGVTSISKAASINNFGTVAGEGWNGSFTSGWTWNPGTGFTFLPALKQGDRDRVHPQGINDDDVVVGYATINASFDWRAFRWDPVRGMVDLNDLAHVPGSFILDRALAISNTGVIVGDGHYGPNWSPAVAFMLVPIETSCYADCDESTGPRILDIFDFLCFGNRFHAGDPYACDCDTATGPGVCDIFDFLCFGNDFSAGCN